MDMRSGEIANEARSVELRFLISNKRECNNCFIENSQEKLLDLADFAL